ncbi:MAG TPA: hypothetical protein ENL22_03515, partial [candidate division Zixibacteria bacterium]|nr:hypothetical protein [candidate division Zixibacteria bacterium]
MQAHCSLPKLLVMLALVSLFTISGVAGEMPLSEFQLITVNEETILGERIKFFNGDTLYGWVHSNDQIAMM